MGREVRMVPEGWEHPTTQTGRCKPLLDGYEEALEEFAGAIKEMGLTEAIDYYSGGPISEDYMLVGVPDSERTQYMMYEDTSEGTPLSPAFETPEELAKWLASNGASSFADDTATYEQWLYICHGGFVPDMVYTPETGMISGLEANETVFKKV